MSLPYTSTIENPPPRLIAIGFTNRNFHNGYSSAAHLIRTIAALSSNPPLLTSSKYVSPLVMRTRKSGEYLAGWPSVGDDSRRLPGSYHHLYTDASADNHSAYRCSVLFISPRLRRRPRDKMSNRVFFTTPPTHHSCLHNTVTTYQPITVRTACQLVDVRHLNTALITVKWVQWQRATGRNVFARLILSATHLLILRFHASTHQHLDCFTILHRRYR